MVNDFPELNEPNSLLSSAFSLGDQERGDEARIIWMKEMNWALHRTDLHGSLSPWFMTRAKLSDEKSPTAATFLMKCSRHRYCMLGDKCKATHIMENQPPILPGETKILRVCDTPFFW